jgi:hypothetical protein
MDEPPELVFPLNPCVIGVTRNRIGPRLWRPQVETSMGPSLVVVSGVGAEDPLEVPPAEHEHPVQTLGPYRAEPSLGKCVRPRCPDRRPDYVHSFCPEDLVEGPGELRVLVPDQEPDALKPFPHCQVAGLLADPCGVGFLVMPRM